MAEAADYERSALSALSPSHLNCRTANSNKRKHVDDDIREPHYQAFTATVGHETPVVAVSLS